MTWTEAGVALSVISAAVLVAKELYTTFWVNPHKDKVALDSAKAQQPEIMRQLELGNFKAAAEGISIAQTFVADQLKVAQAELQRLRDRETALEAEAEGWEHRYRERDQAVDELELRVAKMEGRNEALSEQLQECKRKIFGPNA